MNAATAAAPTAAIARLEAQADAYTRWMQAVAANDAIRTAVSQGCAALADNFRTDPLDNDFRSGVRKMVHLMMNAVGFRVQADKLLVIQYLVTENNRQYLLG